MPHTPGPWTVSDDGVFDERNYPVVQPGFNDAGSFKISVEPEDARLIAQAPAMYELLKELEWAVVAYTTDGSCPVCSYGRGDPHAADCKLAAVLKAVEGTENA